MLLLEIQQVPESEYGYWVTNGGWIIPVGFQKHQTVARREGGFDNYTEAMKAGWIRIIAPPSSQEDFLATLNLPTRNSVLRSVVNIIESRPQYRRYIIEENKAYSPPLLDTDNEKKAINFLKTLI